MKTRGGSTQQNAIPGTRTRSGRTSSRAEVSEGMRVPAKQAEQQQQEKRQEQTVEQGAGGSKPVLREKKVKKKHMIPPPAAAQPAAAAADAVDVGAQEAPKAATRDSADPNPSHVEGDADAAAPPQRARRKRTAAAEAPSGPEQTADGAAATSPQEGPAQAAPPAAAPAAAGADAAADNGDVAGPAVQEAAAGAAAAAASTPAPAPAPATAEGTPGRAPTAQRQSPAAHLTPSRLQVTSPVLGPILLLLPSATTRMAGAEFPAGQLQPAAAVARKSPARPRPSVTWCHADPSPAAAAAAGGSGGAAAGGARLPYKPPQPSRPRGSVTWCQPAADRWGLVCAVARHVCPAVYVHAVSTSAFKERVRRAMQ